MYKVYLAGPISGLSFDGATDWRNDVNNKLKVVSPEIRGYSPLRGKDQYLRGEKAIADSYEQWPLSTAKGITERDRFDCRTSDVVFVNLLGAEKVSIGTVLEIGWASENNIPVILVMEEGNIHDHAMIRETASFIVTSLEQGVDALCAILLPEYELEHLDRHVH